MTANRPLLALRGVAKRFGAVQALGGVDFDVHAGEVIGLVGDNGAGKSTLVKTISGIYEPDEGQFFFDGEPVVIRGPNDAAELGIATVYQDLALCDNLDVVANLFLGNELVAAGAAGLSIPSVRAEVGTMSGGQRQQVAVARSLLGDPKVVLLDEPTAALGVAQTAQVLDLIRRLRERGLGVVVISHNLAAVFEVTDRIVVLRLGRPAGDFDVRGTTQEEVVAAITGAQYGRREDGEGARAHDGGRAAGGGSR
ncbi:MAG: sugar ABC transporter ATP-binding protein [Actinobacteria bacterium]|nr:MAG: sugar ABC transporter ATP-binding protein [Actinomycetota bacterium]